MEKNINSNKTTKQKEGRDALEEFISRHSSSNSTTIESLQLQLEQMTVKYEEKDKLLMESHTQLISNAKLFADLQNERKRNEKQSAEMRKELEAKNEEIKELQSKCDEKDKQMEMFGKKLGLNAKMVKCIVQEKSGDEDNESNNNETNLVLSGLKCILKDVGDKEKMVKVLDLCANVQIDQKQYAEAIDCYKNAIKLEKLSQNREVVLSRFFGSKAHCHYMIDEHQKAIQSATEALVYDSDHIFALDTRACCYYWSENLPNARKDYQKVLELDPKNEEAHKRLAKVEDKLHQQN